MKWISTKIRFPKAGEQVLTACKNKNMEDGIWLYDLCYYYPDTGWEGRVNWEDVLYWTYIDKPKRDYIMEQYIPKSVLLAEIERQKAQWGICKSSEAKYRREMLDDISSFFSTIEMKEVDLEKEIDLAEDKYRGFYSLSRADVIDIAKHFFRLGLKAQKGK